MSLGMPLRAAWSSCLLTMLVMNSCMWVIGPGVVPELGMVVCEQLHCLCVLTAWCVDFDVDVSPGRDLLET